MNSSLLSFDSSQPVSTGWSLNRAGVRVLAVVVLVATIGCGAEPDPRCVARQALRDAVRAVDLADAAEVAGDTESTRRQIAEVERLVGLARARLRSSGASMSSTDRGMLEATEYLEFIVSDFRSSGIVHGALSRFASREMNRAPSPGEAPLNC